MKRLCFLAVAATLAISAPAWADDPPGIPTSPFALGNDLPRLRDAMSSSSPFSNGLGQLLNAWSQQGIFASELADQIPWLQGMDADEIAQRTRWMDYQINNRIIPGYLHGTREDPQRLDPNRQDRVRNRNHEVNGQHRAGRDHDSRQIDRGLSDRGNGHNGTKNNGPGKHSAQLGGNHAPDSHAPNNGAPQSHSPNFKGNSPSHVPPPSHVAPSSHAPPPAQSGGGRGKR
jgi:hypothetical protein